MIPPITAGNAPAITSSDIAELVERRHDNVKRTIETLVQQGVIVRPQMGEKSGFDAMGRARPVRVFHFAGEQGMRDSLVVVAQLSPEFTGRLVDRWQQLERQVAAPVEQLTDLSDPTALRALLATYAARADEGASDFGLAQPASSKPYSQNRRASG
ncbi:Rha family transcriptional regulator [Xanthomonas campestris pv. asclepiadis]|uniref:Rha family transcriptional regulator n=1 Tax=Xanthomonas campestris TaxID=339 RepID=UPI001E6141FB|nr:Rha family transcriptional regulator [Xanthomonas campestris]MCC4618151.1 Rha family transcriptional regulator [Xanthomonas campestris pv. asclepiadis]